MWYSKKIKCFYGKWRDQIRQAVEFAILDWIQAHLRCAFLDFFLPLVTSLSNNGEVWIVLALVLLLFRHRRRQGLSVAAALLLDLVSCNLFLKPLIGRVRPCVVNPAVELLLAVPGDASFPSGHTAVSFAAVSALYFSKSPLWKPAAVLACVIAFSRLYLYVHWPSDVLGGIVLGVAVGWAGAKLAALGAKRLENRKKA